AEFADGDCRCVSWLVPDAGREDAIRHIDPFLSAAIRGIAAAHDGEPVEWLELNHWPSSGRLMVYPSRHGPFGGRTARSYFQLCSDYFEGEWRRIGSSSVVDELKDRSLGELSDRLWRAVGESLRRGAAWKALAEARRIHPCRLAAFDYEPGEGL